MQFTSGEGLEIDEAKKEDLKRSKNELPDWLFLAT